MAFEHHTDVVHKVSTVRSFNSGANSFWRFTYSGKSTIAVAVWNTNFKQIVGQKSVWRKLEVASSKTLIEVTFYSIQSGHWPMYMSSNKYMVECITGRYPNNVPRVYLYHVKGHFMTVLLNHKDMFVHVICDNYREMCWQETPIGIIFLPSCYWPTISGIRRQQVTIHSDIV